MFSRIAIVNRGEAAMRLIHAVRDLNAQAGPDGHRIETVALHTEGERRAMFVREADLAYDLGPAAERPYLNHEVLERALRETGADAAWVGWGFVAEDPNFAELCTRLGVTFIGPSAEAMRQLGDKIGSKLIAEEVGVPVAAWSRGPVNTLDEAKSAAEAIGYPLMLKATAGGGGRGIRKVSSEAELTDAYERTRDEAQRAFGSGVVFLERLVTGARHVEVQVIADGQGTAWAIGVRDCSVQRRNQKVIEESASPVLTPEGVAELKASAERLAVAVGYAGAGTVEFLYHPGEKFFAFLEVNTRLQVEHPITEVTTDTDLVKLQLHVAAGGKLTGERPVEIGHAVEARLNAEDPDRDFAPSPGHISRLDLPTGPGIRVDTGVAEGDSIPADFDSMIAKIIAYGRDRDEALARLRRAMFETTVVIDGGSTNKSFVLDLLSASEVIDGSADTGWIDRVRAEGGLVTDRHSGVALVAAGIEAYLSGEAVERARLIETARGGRPQVQHHTGRAVEVKLRGTSAKVTVFRIGPHRFRVRVVTATDDQQVEAQLDRIDDYTSRLTIGRRTYRLVTASHGPVQLVEVDGITHRVSLDEGGVVRSPAPALVVATPAPVGTEVAAGAPILVLEAMKMETVIAAPFAAKVKEVLVSAGSQVETGAPLMRLEPISDGEQATADEAVLELDLPSGSSLPRSLTGRADQHRNDLAATLLGYDVDPRDEGRTLAGYLHERAELIADGSSMVEDELDLLESFADLADLTRNRPADEELHLENRVHSPREFFHTYLTSFDPERGALPTDFQAKLTRALGHYGVEDLTRTPELEEAVFRVFLAQQRPAPSAKVVTTILERWITEEPPNPPVEGARELLDRLVSATQRRFPVIGDLARSVQFRWYDQPRVDQERRAVLGGVHDELVAIEAMPQGPERDARVDALVAIPEQIVHFLGERLTDGTPHAEEPMIGVLLKRHYREHRLGQVSELTVSGRPFATAPATIADEAVQVISTVGAASEFTPDSELARSVQQQLAAAGEQPTYLDLYLSWPQAPRDTAEVAQQLGTVIDATALPASTRRIGVAVIRDEGPVEYFTFTQGVGEAGFTEDALIRGVHPTVANRLGLWRLREFNVTRLAAPQDVLLYRAVAPDNPADERLVACAQVRQVVLVHDEHGTLVGLPHVEQAVANAVEAIRRVRTASPGKSRLDLNYIWIEIWPSVNADIRQLTALKDKIAPVTTGAGIAEVEVGGTIAGRDGSEGAAASMVARFVRKGGQGVLTSVGRPATEPLHPLDDYAQKVLQAHRRGVVYPYELQAMIAGRGGTAVEYDLDANDRLVPVERPYGMNQTGMIAGVITTPTERYPEGMTRVLLCGDPLKSLGALSEGESKRVIAALDLAEELQVPVEWFSLSSGARISMDSGTENLDWVAKALKRVVEFTQDGGEINIVVAGINVGAQPYWNAEATMLMHTKGILVMTPDSAMVLTGKQSLDFSGGVSAEDNFGIGGYDRVMGPNGEAQYWAPDLAGALRILMAHYDYSYVAPGERRPRPVATTDPVDRDITTFPHDPVDSGFTSVGDIFSMATNPDRKKAFDIRTVMAAVADQDQQTLERWAGMVEAETSVVYDAFIGGIPVTLIGIESKPVPRRGFPPTDGPDVYTAGTLFPKSSKKTARAINAASGNRPVVVLANLSGFDGSPESMRSLQLEYGAEIGRALVNFSGPIVFCVISRYHGGAFVVFSKALNEQMTVLAVEGSYASVLGGAPAAAVVFSREVDARTAKDDRVRSIERQMAECSNAERAALASQLAEVRRDVRAEKLGEMATEFDQVHNIHRAVKVGSVDEVIEAEELRPKIIEALLKGLDQA